MQSVFIARSKTALPADLVRDARKFRQGLRGLGAAARAYVKAAGFEPKPRTASCAAGRARPGGIAVRHRVGGREQEPLPPGPPPRTAAAGRDLSFANTPHDARLAAASLALGAYSFARYRKLADKAVRLVLPDGVDGAELTRIVEGVTLARDLINTPANDMGPAELEAAARALGKQHGAKVRSIVGDDLLKQNFPLIHAGRPRCRPGSRAAAD